jgi:hypothetical protein
MSGSGLGYNILTNTSADFAAHTIRAPKSDGGTPVTESGCATFPGSVWADEVDDQLILLSQAVQGDSPIAALEITGDLTLGANVVGDVLASGAVCARGAAEAQGAATINDVVAGSTSTDNHGITLLTSQYAYIAATASAGTFTNGVKIDCTGHIMQFYGNSVVRAALISTSFHPYNDNVRDIGVAGTARWKDAFFSGCVYADDLDLTGDADVDGTVTAAAFKGGAHLVFLPAEVELLSGCAADVRNNHKVIDFDDSVDEYAIWAGVMPTRYNGGDLTVTVIWTATAAVAGDVRWQAVFERMGAYDDLDVDSWGTTVTWTSTASGTCGYPVYSTGTFTQAQADAIAAGDAFRIRVKRLGTGAADTMVGDAELVAVTIQEG